MRAGATSAAETIWLGAASVEVGPDGWTKFWRLDPHDGPIAFDPVLWERAQMPAGVRARWDVAAHAIELEVRGGDDTSPVDVLFDGDLIDRIRIVHGEQQLHVELPRREGRLELWLPQWGHVAVRGVRFVDGSGRPVEEIGRRWITYGSSITHCREAPGSSVTWPALVARTHALELTCLGFGGQCHLDPVISRVIGGMRADLISMCLGINMYNWGSFNARSLRPQVVGFIESIRRAHPVTPIVVISAIRAPSLEATPNVVGLTLGDVRSHIHDAVDALVELGDENLLRVDGLPLFGEAEAGQLLTDGLHPSPEGYRLLAERLGPIVAAAAGAAQDTRHFAGPAAVIAARIPHRSPPPGR